MLNETKSENVRDLVCRACQETTREMNKMMNLYSTDANFAEFHRIYDLFCRYTFQIINENDGITSYICINCYDMLAEFHKFRQMCVVSYYNLLKQKSLVADGDGPDTRARSEIKAEDPLAIRTKY